MHLLTSFFLILATFDLQDGVILGADTRATEGPIVADKNCAKIHYIAPNIYCCGAGTAADTENTTNMISSQLELHRLRTERESRVATSCRMLKQMLYKYQGHVSVASRRTGLRDGCVLLVGPNRKCRLLMFWHLQISAALVLGGVDVTGPSLYSIYPHGSVDKLPYVTMGSGSLAAMGVFEDGFRSLLIHHRTL